MPDAEEDQAGEADESIEIDLRDQDSQTELGFEE
jgi:hypothetical protein